MRRRDFLGVLGGAAVWPLAARAQQPAIPVVGFLGGASADLFVNQLRAFRQGLNETGYVEGQNVAIEYRWVEGQYDRLPALAGDLVRRQVTVIVTSGGNPPARAAMAATATIPIVFVTGSDPVQVGLVPNLNRPGSNVTGVTSLNMEVGPKRLELMHELVPTATDVAVLVNPTNQTNTEMGLRDLNTAARSMGLQLHALHASAERDFDTIFASLVQLRVGALIITPDALFISRSKQLAALALRHGVPAIFQFRDFATAGGLMSYGGSFTDSYRTAGVYAGRILKGEKVADLPIQQVTKVELVINLKTAKALGLTVPPSLLVRADEVIE